jgi:hypothetical protein
MGCRFWFFLTEKKIPYLLSVIFSRKGNLVFKKPDLCLGKDTELFKFLSLQKPKLNYCAKSV